jgi:hypothetical protein
MYWIQYGNTQVTVEQRNYDGVCDHCGKTRIKYLARVRQGVGDTLGRALKGDLERDDDEIANLSTNLIEGKLHKEMQVGCVCVAKYLSDCGVDSGIATRLQRGVNTVTGILKNLAKIAKMVSPEGCAAIRKDFADVAEKYRLRRAALDQYTASREAHKEARHEGQLPDQEVVKTWRAATVAYVNANDRFRARHFSIYVPRFCYDDPASLTDEIIQNLLGRKQRAYESRLKVYSNRGRYVNVNA